MGGSFSKSSKNSVVAAPEIAVQSLPPPNLGTSGKVAPLQPSVSNSNLNNSVGDLICKECKQPIAGLNSNAANSNSSTSMIKRLPSSRNVASSIPSDGQMVDESIERMIKSSSSFAAGTPLVLRQEELSTETLTEPKETSVVGPPAYFLATSVEDLIASVRLDIAREQEARDPAMSMSQMEKDCYASVFARLMSKCSYLASKDDSADDIYSKDISKDISKDVSNSYNSNDNNIDNIGSGGGGGPNKYSNSKIFHHTHYYMENGGGDKSNSSSSDTTTNLSLKNLSPIKDGEKVNGMSPDKSPNIRQVDHLIKKRY